MFTYFSESFIKWKQYLKIFYDSEVGAKHQSAAAFSFSQNYVFYTTHVKSVE